MSLRVIGQLNTNASADHDNIALLAPLDGLGVVEYLVEFFQRPSFRLYRSQVHQRPVDKMQDQEDGICFPANSTQGYRRRVRVDEACDPPDEALGRHALRSDVVAQDLSRIQSLKGADAERSEDAVEEDHGDECVARSRGDVPVGLGGEHVDRDVHKPRQEESPQQKRAAADLLDKERAADAAKEREDCVQAVHEKLLRRGCDADDGEDGREEVGYDRAADELREYRKEQDDPHSVASLSRVPEHSVVPPGASVAVQLCLELYRESDLLPFEFDEGGIWIAVSVELDQYLHC